MKVAIAGGHGKVGQHLIRLLAERGDEVRSLDRNPAYGDELRKLGAEPVVCDLEEAAEQDVAEAIDGCDAVVFTAGAGPGSGPERKWTMDHGGAVKLLAAARDRGISRYVIVSSVGANPDAPGDDTFSVYLRAKGKADAEIAAAGIQHTIVRPHGLTNDPPTGRVQVGNDLERGKIPRADVAAVVAGCLVTPQTIGRTFEVVSGDVPVADALAGL